MSDTLFKEVKFSLGSLMEFIGLGEIGLPDIQRPFVWPNAKVRDLFDSMYRGYPVGYLLLWQNGLDGGQKTIGTDHKQIPAKLLIVDGQQRLTSLYAVIKGIPVVRESYVSERIEIAFNPLLGKFEVADAAIRKDRSFIPNISKVWSKDTDLFSIVDDYLSGLKLSRVVTDEEDKRIKKAITRLHGMLSFPFTALELASTVDEEQVAEVFVRVNSKGKTLNQADFILTLMSVFWDEGRTELEEFCRSTRLVPAKGKPSPFNHFFEPDPDHLLRISVGLGFRRARLKHVYSILRGKDLDTGEFSEDRREHQFNILKQAQERTLNLAYWHDFMKALRQSGHCSRQTISSNAALLFAYTLYLVGRTVHNADEFRLRRVIARWFFMTTLTGRYTSSPESAMEYDLARLRTMETAEQFIDLLDRLCDETLTQDYWEITLPGELAVSSARSPALFAFYAALVLLDARVLYSVQKVVNLLDPALISTKSAIERHHLFPKAFLGKMGIADIRDTNQVANFALIEWGENISISDQPPPDYAPKLEERFSEAELKRMYYWHALPEGWKDMAYPEFLERRRELIARTIADGYATLAPKTKPKAQEAEALVETLVEAGESPEVEFKATLRTSLHSKAQEERVVWSVLKTITGFLNNNGGTLIIGVMDDGDPVGLQADGFATDEELVNFLIDLLTERVGAEHLKQVHPRFEDYDGVRVLVVECWPGQAPAYLKQDGQEILYVRDGTTTVELSGEQTDAYLKKRFAPKKPVVVPVPTVSGGEDGGGKSPVRHEVRKRFWTQLLDKEKKLSNLHSTISSGAYNWIGVCIDRLWFNYAIREHDGQAELYIDFDKTTGEGNKNFFDALFARKDEIEEAFGGPLQWERLNGKRACRIRKVVAVGGWRDEPQWDEQQDKMIDAMLRLEAALTPHLEKLKSNTVLV